MTKQEPQPMQTKFLAILLFLVVIGLVSLMVSFVEYRTSGAAQAQDVLRNRVLLERLTEVEERRERLAQADRARNEELHACLVDLTLAIVENAPDFGAIENPCPEPLVDGQLSPEQMPRFDDEHGQEHSMGRTSSSRGRAPSGRTSSTSRPSPERPRGSSTTTTTTTQPQPQPDVCAIQVPVLDLCVTRVIF